LLQNPENSHELEWKCVQIILAVMLGLVVSVASVHAQTSNGSIVGSVTDPREPPCGSNGDRYKHRSRWFQTNYEDGFRWQLSVDSLYPAGTSVSIQAAGMQEFVETGVEVKASSRFPR